MTNNYIFSNSFFENFYIIMILVLLKKQNLSLIKEKPKILGFFIIIKGGWGFDRFLVFSVVFSRQIKISKTRYNYNYYIIDKNFINICSLFTVLCDCFGTYTLPGGEQEFPEHEFISHP